MTDAWLMEADCVHGIAWYDCDQCAQPGEDRIALRTYADAGGRGKGPTAEPLDDVVVKDVSMFRIEDMGDWTWMCCYLNGTDDRIAFSIRPGRKGKGEPRIVITAHELPDVRYEGQTTGDTR